MKKFFEDYGELLKHNVRFYKDHWAGSLIVMAASGIVASVPVVVRYYKDKKEFEEKVLGTHIKFEKDS